MKAGNCDQFALIETDQRCIDHVFYRHDDLRGHLLPWEAGDVPAVGRGPTGQHHLDANAFAGEFVL
jgi:hypothetical protein